MVAPAAHTSKGLAKAFVSSAGGKGPENRDTPAPLIVHAEARGCSSSERWVPILSTQTEDLLDRAAVHSKVPLCREDVCRVVPPDYAALCQKGYLEQGLSVGAACRRLWVQAQLGSWRLCLLRASNPFPITPGNQAPGCMTAKASYHY